MQPAYKFFKLNTYQRKTGKRVINLTTIHVLTLITHFTWYVNIAYTMCAMSTSFIRDAHRCRERERERERERGGGRGRESLQDVRSGNQ